MSEEPIIWGKFNFQLSWNLFQNRRKTQLLTIKDCQDYTKCLENFKINLLNGITDNLEITDIERIERCQSEVEVARIFLENKNEFKFVDETENSVKKIENEFKFVDETEKSVVKTDIFAPEMLDKYDPRALRIHRQDGKYWIGKTEYQTPADLPLEFDEDPTSHINCSWEKYINLNRCFVYRKTRCFCQADDDLNSFRCRKLSPHQSHQDRCVWGKVICN